MSKLLTAIMLLILILVIGFGAGWKYALVVWAVVFIGNSIKYSGRDRK